MSKQESDSHPRAMQSCSLCPVQSVWKCSVLGKGKASSAGFCCRSDLQLGCQDASYRGEGYGHTLPASWTNVLTCELFYGKEERCQCLIWQAYSNSSPGSSLSGKIITIGVMWSLRAQFRARFGDALAWTEGLCVCLSSATQQMDGNFEH